LGFLINHYYLHLQAARQLAVIGFVSLGGSYAVWFLGAWIINMFRAPWLLDAESGQLIDAWEGKAQIAENTLAGLKDQKAERLRVHKLFGSLMQAGVNLSTDLAACTADGHLRAWDARLDGWLKLVKKTISDEGFASEAVAFVRAGEDAEQVKGVMNFGWERETRCRVLEQHQKKLEDIVRRRLP
jgi:hypothetical protein